MTIRRAVLADVPALVAMGERFLANDDYRGVIAFDRATVENLMTALVAGDASLLLVAEHEATLLGMIAMLLVEHPIAGVLVATELFWWADRPGCGLKLYKAAEAWATAAGATALQMVAPNQKVGRLYDRLGYRKVEEMWTRKLT